MYSFLVFIINKLPEINNLSNQLFFVQIKPIYIFKCLHHQNLIFIQGKMNYFKMNKIVEYLSV